MKPTKLYNQIETLLHNYHFKPIEKAKVHPNSRIEFTALPTIMQSNDIGEEVHDDVIQTCGLKIAYKIVGFDKRPNADTGTYLVYYNVI